MQKVDSVMVTAPFALPQQVCMKKQPATSNDDGLMEYSCLVIDALEKLCYSDANLLQSAENYLYRGLSEVAL